MSIAIIASSASLVVCTYWTSTFEKKSMIGLQYKVHHP